MAKRKGSFANAIMALPWIVRVILVIFADFIYGIARFVDGLAQHNVLKAVVGFLWIFYGLYLRVVRHQTVFVLILKGVLARESPLYFTFWPCM